MRHFIFVYTVGLLFFAYRWMNVIDTLEGDLGILDYLSRDKDALSRNQIRYKDFRGIDNKKRNGNEKCIRLVEYNVISQ